MGAITNSHHIWNACGGVMHELLRGRSLSGARNAYLTPTSTHTHTHDTSLSVDPERGDLRAPVVRVPCPSSRVIT